MFIIPMAGLSSRFFTAGFTVPKYQIILPNQMTMFEWSVNSFKNYFKTDLFVFIVRNVYDTSHFVDQMCHKLGILNFRIVVLQEETKGQAETVYLGIKTFDDLLLLSQESIYIFNIDSYRHNFIKPACSITCDGYLEVFKGEGEHWSFIQVNEQNKVIRTTEKDRISDLCSDGLYFFKSIETYIKVVEHGLKNNMLYKNELYIAPLYNILIEQGLNICYELVEMEDIEFCGTPTEFESISKKLLDNQE